MDTKYTQVWFQEGNRHSSDTRARPHAHIPAAQFIAVCRRSKLMSMGLRRHRKGSRLCRRCALPRGRDTPRLRQILHATKCDKLSDFYSTAFSINSLCLILVCFIALLLSKLLINAFSLST